MSLWNQWLPGASDEPGTERVPHPRVGETVRLHAVGDAHLGVYHARVRALGLRRIILDSPESAASAEPAEALPPHTRLTLSFIRADYLYQCETRVVGPAKAGTLTVTRPRVITRVQRRQFYRLPLQSPTTFRVHGETGSTAPIAARLVNLSGGGALLASPKPVLGGLRVSVNIPTGKAGDLLEVEADALDCRVTTQGRTRTYLVRLRFLGPPLLAEEERDEIVAYIFEQQRFLLRNRKLLRA
jgi:c-di-GMP-binding flagellar brake protein YcgR